MADVDWDAAGAEALGHLRSLLRFDTTNPPGNERPAADYVAEVLAREGIEHTIVESAPTRASVVARIRGSGKAAPLLLNGHLDVVPADADHWRHPPFAAEEHEGCLWGRGAIDMKNMVAMSLMTLVLLRRERIALDRDVIFAAVADEEAGSRFGSRFLVEEHPELVRAEYVLNEVGAYTLYFGDTVFYPVQVAEKGICWFEMETEGTPGHGSMPRPDNAVVRLARAIDRLDRARLEHHHVPAVEGFLKRLAEAAPFPQNKAMPLVLRPGLAGALLDLVKRRDVERGIAMDAMLHNTASPNGLSAGEKVNVIPHRARAEVDGRLLPGRTVESFLAEVQRVVGPDVKLSVMEAWEGTEFSAETPLFRALCRSLSEHHPGSVPVPYMAPGFTDSAAYATLGATCYGFAPTRLPAGLNFSGLFHGHDERIPIEGFLWGLRVLYDVVSDFCAER